MNQIKYLKLTKLMKFLTLFFQGKIHVKVCMCYKASPSSVLSTSNGAELSTRPGM